MAFTWTGRQERAHTATRHTVSTADEAKSIHAAPAATCDSHFILTLPNPPLPTTCVRGIPNNNNAREDGEDGEDASYVTPIIGMRHCIGVLLLACSLRSAHAVQSR